jgi:ribosomal protein S27E
MLITKRGERPNRYLKIKCPMCGTELITDTINEDCDILNDKKYIPCPVCGCNLWYDSCGRGYISEEEYNKIKSQYMQKE